tara:strand:- start:3824 stop:4417 length:594 start_codon:yes stop_codon:yes gene_type:complete
MYNSISTYYKVQSHIYDLTRWSFLFGRSKLFSRLPDLPQNASILDLGCGTGYQLSSLRKRYPKANIIGLDASSDMLKKAHQKLNDNVTLLHQQYQKSSFPENSFDLVVCSYSLTMMGDIDEILSHVSYHLKPKGSFAVIDFDYSRFDWFTRWMKVNFVEMSGRVFSTAKHQFPSHTLESYSAYTGLWIYSLFFATNI